MTDSLPPSLLAMTTYLLSLTGKAARTTSADALAAEGLRMGDMAALAVLDHEGPVPQRVIAERLRLHPSDVVRLLDGLERDRLLARAPDPTDRRRHLVTLTAAGKRRLQEAAQACDRAAESLLAPLDRAQRATLHELLATVLAAADDRVPAPPLASATLRP